MALVDVTHPHRVKVAMAVAELGRKRALELVDAVVDTSGPMRGGAQAKEAVTAAYRAHTTADLVGLVEEQGAVEVIGGVACQFLEVARMALDVEPQRFSMPEAVRQHLEIALAAGEVVRLS